MPEKKKTQKKTAQSTDVPKKAAQQKKKPSLTVPVFDLKGKKSGTMALPAEIFGAPASEKLIAQAVRVFQANRRQGGAVAQTRSEVTGSGRKVWRQKGTGRARHGERNAPIFVGGGVSHGPRPRDFSMRLNKKMKRKALFGVLTAALKEDKVRIVDTIEKAGGKTKDMTVLMKNLAFSFSRTKLAESVLLATPGKVENAVRAGRNIQKLTICESEKLTPYMVVHHKRLVFSRSAIDTMKKTFLEKKAVKEKTRTSKEN